MGLPFLVPPKSWRPAQNGSVMCKAACRPTRKTNSAASRPKKKPVCALSFMYPRGGIPPNTNPAASRPKQTAMHQTSSTRTLRNATACPRRQAARTLRTSTACMTNRGGRPPDAHRPFAAMSFFSPNRRQAEFRRALHSMTVSVPSLLQNQAEAVRSDCAPRNSRSVIPFACACFLCFPKHVERSVDTVA